MMKTAKQKAQSGLELLKVTVLEVIKQHPDGIRNSEIARILGLESCDRNDGQKNWLTKSIFYILERENKVHQREARGLFFPGKGQ